MHIERPVQFRKIVLLHIFFGLTSLLSGYFLIQPYTEIPFYFFSFFWAGGMLFLAGCFLLAASVAYGKLAYRLVQHIHYLLIIMSLPWLLVSLSATIVPYTIFIGIFFLLLQVCFFIFSSYVLISLPPIQTPTHSWFLTTVFMTYTLLLVYLFCFNGFSFLRYAFYLGLYQRTDLAKIEAAQGWALLIYQDRKRGPWCLWHQGHTRPSSLKGLDPTKKVGQSAFSLEPDHIVTPDGQYIIAFTKTNSAIEVTKQEVSSGLKTIITKISEDFYSPSGFSPDGEWLLLKNREDQRAKAISITRGHVVDLPIYLNTADFPMYPDSKFRNTGHTLHWIQMNQEQIMMWR